MSGEIWVVPDALLECAWQVHRIGNMLVTERKFGPVFVEAERGLVPVFPANAPKWAKICSIEMRRELRGSGHWWWRTYREVDVHQFNYFDSEAPARPPLQVIASGPSMEVAGRVGFAGLE